MIVYKNAALTCIFHRLLIDKVAGVDSRLMRSCVEDSGQVSSTECLPRRQ